MIARGLSVVDWIVLGGYIALLLGIGLYFSRRQRTTEEYFLGNRRTRPVIAGLSLLAAVFSVVTYLGTTGEYIQYGPALAIYITILSIPILQLTVGWLLIPVIMRLPITSAYELLEARLGRRARQTGSLMFTLMRVVWMALILYVGANVVIRVIDCAPDRRPAIIALIGAITTLYTLMGGIRAVMITGLIQFSILLLGALLTIVFISIDLGGVAAWGPRHRESHWIAQPLFSLDPHLRVSLIGAFVSGLIAAFCSAGSDQNLIQRFLTTRDAPAARRAYLFKNLALSGMCSVMALVGAALLGFFRFHPEAIPRDMSVAQSGDMFFPLYIGHYLPAGVRGIVVAGILAAVMSGLSAGINSVITVISKDFVETAWPEATAKVRIARFLALAVGAWVVAGSFAIGMVRGDLVEVAGKTVNLLISPLFGLFFLAIFVRYATAFGAYIGVIYSGTAAILVAYWEVFTGLPPISFLWVGPVALAVSMASGCLFSLLPTRGRPWPIVGAYSAGALGALGIMVLALMRHFLAASPA